MTAADGQTLVAFARSVIAAALGGTPPVVAPGAWLSEWGASFVTLTQAGELRGCIGTLEARRPLVEDLRENALAAAFRDPRFPPLSSREFPTTAVEVSLLSALSPVEFGTEDEALAVLRPGVDGIVLESGRHRATFLPQVWEQLPEPRRFLAHLKVKAGLAPGHWNSDLRLFRYTVDRWTEAPGAP